MEQMGFSVEIVGYGISLGVWGAEFKKPIIKKRLERIAELAKDDDGVIFEQITEEHFIITFCAFDDTGEPKMNKRLKNHIDKLIEYVLDQVDLRVGDTIKAFVK